MKGPLPPFDAFARGVLWEAFDQLIGEGRAGGAGGVGGSIPVRFPSQADPGDAGWHIEGSFEVGGDWWVGYRSRARGLLALYLFSGVDTASAPTRVRPGSHRDAARVLAPAGDEGPPDRDQLPDAPEDPVPPFAVHQLLPGELPGALGVPAVDAPAGLAEQAVAGAVTQAMTAVPGRGHAPLLGEEILLRSAY